MSSCKSIPAEEAKSKFRHRIIGAGLLTLTAVLVLPLIFDRPPTVDGFAPLSGEKLNLGIDNSLDDKLSGPIAYSQTERGAFKNKDNDEFFSLKTLEDREASFEPTPRLALQEPSKESSDRASTEVVVKDTLFTLQAQHASNPVGMFLVSLEDRHGGLISFDDLSLVTQYHYPIDMIQRQTSTKGEGYKLVLGPYMFAAQSLTELEKLQNLGFKGRVFKK